MIRHEEARLVNEVMADHHVGNDDQPHPFLLKMDAFDMAPVSRKHADPRGGIDPERNKGHPRICHLPPAPGPRARASKARGPPRGYRPREEQGPSTHLPLT